MTLAPFDAFATSFPLVLLPSLPVAYIDPGTGSMLWQVAISSIVGFLVALRLFWNRIVARFRRRRDPPAQEPGT